MPHTTARIAVSRRALSSPAAPVAAAPTTPIRITPAPSTDERETDAFRTAMRYLAGAVSVVTTGTGEQRTGFTATSLSSLSVSPPTILVCLNRDSSSWPVLHDDGRFCVNVLAHDHLHVADRFAGRGGAKGVARYEGAQWQTLKTGALALSGALAAIDCELEESLDRHSHTILIGRVKDVAVRDDADPLLYWHGAYRLLSNIDRILTRA